MPQDPAQEYPTATVRTKAGLYYGMAGAADLLELDAAVPANWTLGDGSAKAITGEKPAEAVDKAFYRLRVKP